MKLFTVEQRKKLLEEELKRIVEILKRDYTTEKIILFGSLADGNVHEWSDIDLLIIKETTNRPIERMQEVCRLINPRVGIDLFIYTPEEFDALIREKISFLIKVTKRGKLLYEKGI